jgi:hypothetical protein
MKKRMLALFVALGVTGLCACSAERTDKFNFNSAIRLMEKR